VEQDPEKVEVKRVRRGGEENRGFNFAARLNNAIAPLAGGLIIDLLDIATFGPFGLYVGLIIGFAAGWWVSSVYHLEKKTKIICSLLAGIYCMFPGTAFFPLATIISVAGGFFRTPRK